MTLEGAIHVHNSMVKFSGASQKFYILAISQNIDGFRQNDLQGF